MYKKLSFSGFPPHWLDEIREYGYEPKKIGSGLMIKADDGNRMTLAHVLRRDGYHKWVCRWGDKRKNTVTIKHFHELQRSISDWMWFNENWADTHSELKLRVRELSLVYPYSLRSAPEHTRFCSWGYSALKCKPDDFNWWDTIITLRPGNARPWSVRLWRHGCRGVSYKHPSKAFTRLVKAAIEVKDR